MSDPRPLTLQDFGYAPGNYSCICFACSEEFIGDKRAIQCEGCATMKLRRSAAQPAADTIAKPQGFPTSKPDSLCWLTFLNARATAIDWLLAEFKYDDAQIATYLSMDPVQVRLIRERDRRLDVQSPETPAERELFSQVGQLIAGWKQGCQPGEWSDFDEQVLRSWQAWRVAQMPLCPRDDLPSACGERFGPGDHHECRLQPNHDDACKCSCGAIRS